MINLEVYESGRSVVFSDYGYGHIESFSSWEEIEQVIKEIQRVATEAFGPQPKTDHKGS